MRQRIAALGGVGAAALLALLLLWGGIDTKPVSAMEQMAESIRKAKSYKAVVTTEAQLTPVPGKPPVIQTTTGTLYWLAPGSFRVDMLKSDGGPSASESETTVGLTGKTGINIDHKAKTFRRLSAAQLSRAPDVAGVVQNLGEFRGQADRELGTKEINGKTARGFEIALAKLFPQYRMSGTAEVWIDAESSLLALVRFAFNSPLEKTASGDRGMRAENFQWNIDLDPKLFDTTSPKGYTDETPKESSRDESTRGYIDDLRIYAELTEGHYPQVSKNFEDVMAAHDEWYKRFGFEESLKGPVPPELKKNEKYRKVRQGAQSMLLIYSRLVQDPETAYYGKTVGPNDKDKVLFRWKLDDGRYEVIFGDLRAETVTAERLRTLEGK